MANLKVLDGDNQSQYLKASGLGTDVDALVPQHLDTNSAAILAALQAIQTAVQLLDNVVSGAEAQVDVVAPLPAGTNTIGNAVMVDAAGNSMNYAKEADNWNAADHGIILFGRDVDTTPEKYRSVQLDANGHLKVSNLVALPAGDNNIGNVDVASSVLPTGAATDAKLDTTITALGTLLTELQAKADLAETQPVSGTVTASVAVATITTTAAAHATSGDNTVIAAPGAGNRLVIKGVMVQNESAVATTILLKSGATTKRRALLQNQGDGVAWSFDRGDEWRLGTNEALVLNLSGANSHGVTVDYLVEAV